MALTPSAVRTDLKCGKGSISPGEKCTKGSAQQVTVTQGLEKMPTKALKSHYYQLFDSLIKKYPGKLKNDNDFKKWRHHRPAKRSDAAGRACGESFIAAGKTCRQKGAFPTRKAIAAGLGVAALGVGAYALSRRGGSSGPPSSFKPSGPPRLPGLTPKALLTPAPPRQSKTQRMRANTAAAVRTAEGRIGQTAREEVRRIAQIGNTMAATGEAAGMATKTTMRELRLRTEAARRRWEPGYRAPDQRRLPGAIQAQLPEGGITPERVAIPIDPRTGQPSRRRARGFGRTDNYIQHYAPVLVGAR